MASPDHPYYPQNLSLPNYVPNTLSPLSLCVGFGGLAAAIVAVSWALLGRINGSLSVKDKSIAIWLFMCGLMHVLFEGYFLTHHSTLQSRTDIPAQLWKEYALSDSRYLSSDEFVIGIESLTIFIWGPVCIVTAAFISASSNCPIRYGLQIITGVAHFYGCLLYFLTAWVGGNRHSRPEPIYFWGYYIGVNAIWIIVPSLIIFDTFKTINAAFDRKFEVVGKKNN